MEDFIVNDPALDTQWRSLILFGKNSATYKFAFGKSLLDLVNQEKTIVTLEELADPYSRYILEHLEKNDKQGNSQKSEFLNACRARLNSSIDDNQLREITIRKGFVNVVDAFQNVAGGTISKPFYEKDYSRTSKKLVLTDDLLTLKELYQYENLFDEVESRWKLVETAWNIGISPNLLQVRHDESNNELFIGFDGMKRVDVTTARGALNGYQKGQCFYCCRGISIQSGHEDVCHVDHFLPHAHKVQHLPANINGVWNLVLSCSTCNGASEKGMRVADKSYLFKLNKRNEWYILSKHPLAETIINQTGITSEERQGFLRQHYQIAFDLNSTSLWKPKEVFDCS
jgi:hypothetical protein